MDPIAKFSEIFERAAQSGIVEPSAMALATADADGRPAVRMMLLKGVDESGFVFYTNLDSRKAGELRANPHAALCFFWAPMEIQVRVEGPVEPVEDDEADEYFATRPRGSQIGAWASRQSRPLASREVLEEGLREVEQRFGDGPVTRPPNWSGFRVRPMKIEIWYGRPSRLHDREVYTPDGEGGWRMERLYP